MAGVGALRAMDEAPREPGSVVHTDGLGCFRGVEAEGCEHKPRMTGGGRL